MKMAKDTLTTLQRLEKCDEDRRRTLESLDDKVNKLCEKVENLNRTLRNRNRTQHTTNRLLYTIQKLAEPEQIRIETVSECNAGDNSDDIANAAQVCPSHGTKMIQCVRKMCESEKGHDKENSISKDGKKVASVYNLSQTEELLQRGIRKDTKGLRCKETERSVDNRVRTMYREECVPGKMTKDARTKYRTPHSADTPTINNLPTRQEFLSVKTLGAKSMMRSKFEQQHPRSRSDFKTLGAGLMRDQDEVPSIKDLNTWRRIADKEKNRGMFSDAPRAETGLETCLLLDISESMQGKSFYEMIEMAKLYVRGIENVGIALPDFAENIGIATFGQYIGVVQHMTNDYKKIQDTLDMLTPGGSSPMSAGLYMGLACCFGTTHGSSFRPAMYKKIIMFTDGIATSDVAIQSDADDPPSNYTETMIVNMSLEEASQDVGRRDIRVYCYAIGCESNAHIKTITKITGGKIYRGDDIYKLIRMTQITNYVLGRITNNLPGTENLDDSTEDNLWQAIGLMDSNCDNEEVMHLTKFFKSKNTRYTTDEKRYMEKSDSSLPPVGTRVRRGPDWSWGNQDSKGPGTVVGSSSPGHVWVEWDNGNLNIYKYHEIFGFDVLAVQEPRILRSDELITVGCLVQRGANWRFKDQDGGEGNVGVVIKVDRSASVLYVSLGTSQPSFYGDLMNKIRRIKGSLTDRSNQGVRIATLVCKEKEGNYLKQDSIATHIKTSKRPKLKHLEGTNTARYAGTSDIETPTSKTTFKLTIPMGNGDDLDWQLTTLIGSGVRWPNKKRAVYKYGNSGLFEVKICDPSKVYGSPGNLKIRGFGTDKQIRSNMSMENKETSSLESKKSKEDEKNKRYIRKEAVTIDVSWSYKNDETWYVYPDNVNVKIEKAFQRNSQLCIVEVQGEIFQISFKKMVQICSKTGKVKQIKRVDKNNKSEGDQKSDSQGT